QLRVYVNEAPQIDIRVQEGEASGPLHRSRRLTRSSCPLDNHCAGRCQPGGKGLVEDPRLVGVAHKVLCDILVAHFVGKSQCILWRWRCAFSEVVNHRVRCLVDWAQTSLSYEADCDGNAWACRRATN